MTKPIPAIFFGHGNPMNALQSNAWTKAWAAIGNIKVFIQGELT